MNKQENFSGATISPKAVFGIRSDLPHNISFFAGDRCAYVAGNYIVITTIKDKAQYFIQGIPEYGEITSFGIDEYAESIILAIGQRTPEGKPFLTVRMLSKTSMQQMDQGRVNKFTLTDLDVNDFYLSISVNAMKGFIATLIGPKTPSTIVIYQYDLRSATFKMLPVTFMTNLTNYKQISINPFNPISVALYGEGGFSVFQINEQEKKISNKLEVDPKTSNFIEFTNYVFNFVSMTWINKTRVAFLNSVCDVFIIDFAKKLDNPLKKVVKSVHIFDTQSKGKSIFMKSGNLFVCKEDGLIAKLEDKQQLDKNIGYEKVANSAKYVTNLPRIEVHYLSANNPLNSSPNFSAILMSTTNSLLYYIDISNENTLSDGNNYKHFLCAFHTEEIICLDVSKLKQLVVTGSRDRYIKIWNYINLQLECTSEQFEEDPLEVSFHPNGLHLAVLFREKFRLMHILEKHLLTYKEITVFQPNDIKFSNFGNMFAVCYKNSFQIYNFYTCEAIISSKMMAEGLQSHTDDIMNFNWDQDDTGFATCGIDGRAFYWQLYSKEPQLIDFYNREFHFTGVDIYTCDDMVTKKLLLIDENYLIEVSQQSKEDPSGLVTSTIPSANKNKESETSNAVNYGMGKKEKPKILLSNVKFSKICYDKETKVLIASSFKENVPTIYMAKYPMEESGRGFVSFQANSHGIKSMKTSFDMTHLFTCGKDKCLFFFNIMNVAKSEKRDETLEPGDLILVRKEDLDREALDLRIRLNKIDSDIAKENERYQQDCGELENEIAKYRESEAEKQEKFMREKNSLQSKCDAKVEAYEEELKAMYQEHKRKMEELRAEQERSKIAKDNDRAKEENNLKHERGVNESHQRQLKVACDEDTAKLKEHYNKILTSLNLEIKSLEEQNQSLTVKIEKEKSEKMDFNDTQISFKRLELENLKKTYERVKSDHHKLEEKLKSEIKEIRDNIKSTEMRKNEDKNKLLALQSENAKLVKQINDMQNDKKEKEDTIHEKNNIKRDLEKENQELEKFKFVLNYKIKELKHEKDPEEKKMQLLQKQKKDMEEEIKKFQAEQDRNIRELAKNHDTMKVKENDILKIEKNIEKMKNYKKLFQESLHYAMKISTNHKELKKELVNLKRLFLDKEFIEIVEKPNESNYESQRHFLEDNLSNFKKKIKDTQKLFTQDHSKIMRENRKLLNIVNELEKEKKEIKTISNEVIHMNKTSNVLRPKMTLKPILPPVVKGEDGSNENKIISLKKELFELEKELQFIKEKKKKENLKLEKEKSRIEKKK